ncbi:MAG: SCO family protein [Nitrospirae bacterium]|nr:SCO family protein [Nitrospirota bacterium]
MKALRENRIYFTLLFFALVAAISLWSWRGINNPSKAEASVPRSSTRLFEPPIPLNALSLTDHNGREFNAVRFMGNWTFIFFGYTNCPDVCPVALVDLNAVYSGLEKGYELGNTKVVFVSVDPQRDSLGHLAEYVTYFNKNFLGITGTPGQIEEFAGKFGAAYKKVYNEGKGEDYLVDHTASIMLVDHLGRLIAVFPPPHDANFIKAEFIKLRDKYGDGYGCLVN